MENGFRFYKATERDAEEVLLLYRSHIGAVGCTWNEYYPDMSNIAEDTADGSLYCLREADSTLAAAAFAGRSNELDHLVWSSNMKNPCDLARICVAQRLLRNGVATLMLDLVTRDAVKRGFDGMRMLVAKNNLAALALYGKAGFSRIGEAVMYGIDFYCYEKVLRG